MSFTFVKFLYLYKDGLFYINFESELFTKTGYEKIAIYFTQSDRKKILATYMSQPFPVWIFIVEQSLTEAKKENKNITKYLPQISKKYFALKILSFFNKTNKNKPFTTDSKFPLKFFDVISEDNEKDTFPLAVAPKQFSLSITGIPMNFVSLNISLQEENHPTEFIVTKIIDQINLQPKDPCLNGSKRL